MADGPGRSPSLGCSLDLAGHPGLIPDIGELVRERGLAGEHIDPKQHRKPLVRRVGERVRACGRVQPAGVARGAADRGCGGLRDHPGQPVIPAPVKVDMLEQELSAAWGRG